MGHRRCKPASETTAKAPCSMSTPRPAPAADRADAPVQEFRTAGLGDVERHRALRRGGGPQLALSGRDIERQSMSALPRISDVDLLSNGKRIVDLVA